MNVEHVLVVNAGSSSLKLRVLDRDDCVVASLDHSIAEAEASDALRRLLDDGKPIDAVGHRVVHGGPDFTGPVRLTREVEARIEALTDLAPLHQPKSIEAVRRFAKLLPGVPAVACFDTAFHATMPPAAHTYAIPREWRERWSLRRFGFHGLSHAWAARRAAALLARDPHRLRIVTCHLGSGASLAAVKSGCSVDTTMGFTPLDGLVMATRSGAIDPGLVLWLEEHVGMAPADLAATLEHRSGLLALAGSGDMRRVLEAERTGDHDAALAVGVYLHRLCGSIAAMAAAMGGLDALVFTGGVGENSPLIRQRTTDALAWLGVSVDPARNRSAGQDADISAAGAAVCTLLIVSREDIEIARQTRAILESRFGPDPVRPTVTS